VVIEVVKKTSDEDEEEEEEAPAEEDDEDAPKVPAFKIEDHKWTVSDRNPKPLPVLYVMNKGTSAYHDVK
jgi:hypothetical protein